MSSQAPNSMLEFLRSTMDRVQLKRSELLAKLENFYVATKMDDKFSLEFSIMISEIAAGNMPEGYAIAVPGKSGSGKSTMIRHRLQTHPGLQPYVDQYGNKKQACLWVKTPAGCSMKSLGELALKAAGYPGGTLKNETAIWDKLRDALMVKEYKIVFFDEFQHVLHATTSKSKEHPANQVKAIMQSDTWPVWLILSGVDDMMGVIEADPHQQTSRRTRVVEMELLTENEITFVASVLNELCSTVGFSVSFKPTRKFIMRLMHGGLQRFGMVVQLMKLSIQSAIFDDKTFHHKVINHDHFAAGYRRLSNCDDSTNVFIAEDWFNIARELDENGRLTTTQVNGPN